MDSEHSDSFQFDPNFNFFAESSSYKEYYPASHQAMNQHSLAYFREGLTYIENNPVESDFQEEGIFPHNTQQQQNNSNQDPKQDRKQSEKHNFPKHFIYLLKKILKSKSQASQIDNAYVCFVQSNMKYSIKSLVQFIMPFPITNPENKNLQERALQMFDQFYHVNSFSLLNNEKKIDLLNSCKQKIRKQIYSKSKDLIGMVKTNCKIRDQIKRKKFHEYVSRRLKDLQNNIIKGKDKKDFS